MKLLRLARLGNGSPQNRYDDQNNLLSQVQG